MTSTKIGLTASQLTTKQLIEAQAFVASAMPTEDIEDLINAYNYIDTIGPIVDPTEWRDLRNTLPKMKALAKAYLEFRRAIDGLAKPEASGDGA